MDRPRLDPRPLLEVLNLVPASSCTRPSPCPYTMVRHLPRFLPQEASHRLQASHALLPARALLPIRGAPFVLLRQC